VAADGRHVLIVGGGIGGLTASIALRNEGFTTAVFERQRGFAALGVGVILCSNAIKSFGALGRGVRETVEADGFRFTDDFLHREHFHTAEAEAERTASREGPTIEEEFGAPQVAIRRSQLLAILLRAHGEDGLHADRECIGFEGSGEEVVARFDDGPTASGDVLVGADGLGSVVRALFHGGARPDYTGSASLRGLTPGFELPDDMPEGVTAIRKLTGMLAVPVVPGSEIVYWSAGTPAPEGSWPHDDVEAARSLLLERIADWRLFPEIVREADPTTLVAREHRDRPPLPSWGSGRVTLLGDAAHPMTNMWGQGVATATEDGVMLARCLAAGVGDPEPALRRYEALRVPRTSRIVAASHTYGDRGADPDQFTRWLYEYDAGTEPLTV
jgi:2-polyprenyl-6-methoxyphenol hydroxylase-like FAD-dependent oxidoreductase